MHRRIKIIISLILCLVCMSLLTLPLVGCNGTTEPELKELHVFDFRTPEGFDSLSPEEQLEWAKENGYFVKSKKYSLKNNNQTMLIDEVLYYNPYLLKDFLNEPTEGAELLIMSYAKEKNQEVADVTFYGLYFDGGRYHLGKKEAGKNDALAYGQYKICGIEDWRGTPHLYVSNDSELTYDDQMRYLASSVLTDEDFYKKYCAFFTVEP